MKKRIIILLISFLLSGCISAAVDETLYSGPPEALICQEQDLPGEYYLMEDLSGLRPNEELNINVDEPEATPQYIELTGRLTGWEHRFMLVELTQTLPGFILCQVVIFETNEGANQALQWPYDGARITKDNDRQIGDEMILTEMTFDAPDGSPWIDTRVEFTFNNLLGAVSTYAPENMVDVNYALDLAELMHQRMLENTP